MTTTELFNEFLDGLEITNRDQISGRYEEVTSCLNKRYRDTESKIANSLQVGSYGRRTAINGISDLDMIYMLPKSEWDRFKDGRQSALLQEVRAALLERYPRTEISGDGQVVTISFTDQDIEVVPAFEEGDGTFTYPDTNDGGSWKTTNPRAEIEAISEQDSKKNTNLRKLCKMIRAWKNTHGLDLGGLLIDTIAYNFLDSTNIYDSKSYSYFDEMVRDFFDFMGKLPDQEYFLAPGSRQFVYVTSKFQKKAAKAYELVLKAIEAEGQANVNQKWKKVFGRFFPGARESVKESLNASITNWKDTEEFIEDKYPVDIRYPVHMDCEVLQDGYRKQDLRSMLASNTWLQPKKKLTFSISQINVPGPYEIRWKVLNRGPIAERRDEIRGQIFSGGKTHVEHTKFKGEHLVECYVIKQGRVVARDRIDVPIATGE